MLLLSGLAAAPGRPAGLADDTGQAASALRIACAYITQAVQRPDGSVPLVAGRDGLLRVFVLGAEDNRATASVRVTLRDAGGAVRWRRILVSARPGVPAAVDEDHLDGSLNARIPGACIQPGLTLQAGLLPGDAGRRRPVPVRILPAVRVTLVPVRWGGSVGNVDRDGRKAGDWLRVFRNLFPVGRVDLRVAPEFDASRLPGEGPDRSEVPFAAIAAALEARRPPGDHGFTYGAVRLPAGSAYLGEGGSGRRHRTAVGWDGCFASGGCDFATTFAHELGHCFGRDHAPAREAGGPPPDAVDPGYPVPDGSLDASGIDLGSNPPEPKPRHLCTDIMGYGPRALRWCSAYTWQGVMDFLTGRRRPGRAHLNGAQSAERPAPPR
jgi:hypothetical protein